MPHTLIFWVHTFVDGYECASFWGNTKSAANIPAKSSSQYHWDLKEATYVWFLIWFTFDGKNGNELGRWNIFKNGLLIKKKRNRFQILQCFQFQFWRPSWVHNSPATSPQALNILIDHQILLFAHFPKVVNPRPKKGHFFVDSNETRTKITCSNRLWHNFFSFFANKKKRLIQNCP